MDITLSRKQLSILFLLKSISIC